MDQRKPKRNWKKILLISIAVFLTANFLVIMPVMTVVVYETIFNRRYEPASWTEFDVSDFEDLVVERSSFSSKDGQRLAGYHYFKSDQPVNGVVVLSHGLGCGGQNSFMPFADYFTSNGYLVFAYDATGNGESEGDSVRGLPQGIVDLDFALRYVKSLDRYKDLPVVLLGHSWGAYSVGAVLNLHPDVEAAVLISGPDRSIDLMLHESKNYVGVLAIPEVPYLMLYERLKFGSYSAYSVLDGLSSTDARIMIVQSMNDASVPPQVGYEKFYEAFANDSRFEFITYEDRGHDYLYYSAAAEVYRNSLNADYLDYVESHGGVHNAEIKEAFMDRYLDKSRCFELDPDLMERITDLYNTGCGVING